MTSRKLAVAVAAALTIAARTAAAQTIPYLFTANTPARASEVNANFSAMAQAIAAAMPVGTVLPYAGESAPVGFLLCNGDAVSRTVYPALFMVIGTRYGAGDGTSTFTLPDLRARVPVGAIPGGPALGADRTARTLAATGGAETVTLTTAQSGLPGHTHGGTTSATGAHYHVIPIQQPGGSQLAWVAPGGNLGNGIEHPTTEVADHTHTFITSQSAAFGASAAHENMPPYLGLNWIIKH